MRMPWWRRHYAVTVMDHWTPMRFFWTLDAARRWRDTFNLNGPDRGPAHLYKWTAERGCWQETK